MPFASSEIVLAVGAESDFPPGLELAVGVGPRQIEFAADFEALHRVRPTVTLLLAHAVTAEWVREASRAGSRVIVFGRMPEPYALVDLFRAGANDFVSEDEGAYGVASAIDRLPEKPGPAEPPTSEFSVPPPGDFRVTPSGDVGYSRSMSPAPPERRPSSFPPVPDRRPRSDSPTASVPPGRPTILPPPRPPSQAPKPNMAPGAEHVLAALAGRTGAGILAKAQIGTPTTKSGGVITGAQATAIRPSAVVDGGRIDDALPALDPGLAELQEMMGRPECPVDDVERFVVKDPSLVVAVLRMANSAYFRSPRLVTNIREACVRLGNRQVFALLLESLLRRTFTAPKADVKQLFEGMWRNAALTARVARRLAEWQRFARPEDVYVAALLHNLGEFVLAWRVAGEHEGDVAHALATEAERIQREHEAVGQLAAQKWGLPPMVQVLAGNHHRVRHGEPAQDAAMRAAVSACWHLARSVGGEYLPGMQAPDPLPLFDEMGLSEQLRARIAEECIAALEGL